MLKAQFGSKFKKDYKKARKQSRDVELLKKVMPDWLLIYRLAEDTIVFIRTGSHTEVL